MKQLFIRSGAAVLDDVPAPMPARGGILVRTTRSCISAGTEGAGIAATAGSLPARALKHPERVLQVLETVAARGVRDTIAAVKSEIGFGHPTGYSLAGRVHAVGEGIASRYVPGQRVACAGAAHANHAEFVSVPENLVVPVPDGVSDDAAATVALGAIALQGVRRVEPTLGERVVVLGLGILGQLAAQILRANGCRVIGTDLDPERVALALSLGMHEAVDGGADAAAAVHRLTDGHGADAVLIAAAGASDDIVSLAFRMCRRRGRVVLLGDVGLGLRREDLYRKELDFRIATSYGPGRYDERYEEKGLDYPIGYVRWTENRNMRAYLELLADGTVRVEPLVGAVVPLADAGRAYATLGERRAAPIVLLAYPETEGAPPAAVHTVAVHGVARRDGAIGIAVIGAGGFARSVHLPNLRRHGSAVELRAIVNRSGASALKAARQFGAAVASTDVEQALGDERVAAVLICTRHDLHAELVLRALEAGKHVFVEKPLALGEEELAGIERFYADAAAARRPAPVLMTGFNRRFSPFARALRDALATRSGPAMLSYRMNAGYVPPDHWIQTEEGGGRNLGEACHVYDLFLNLIGAEVADVAVDAIVPSSENLLRNDNFTATIRFRDGSLATLLYTALGSTALPKERLEAFADGAAAVLDDYRSVEFFGGRGKAIRRRRQDKGHRAALAAFLEAVSGGGPWPISLQEQLAATRLSLRVEAALAAAAGEA